MEEDILNYSPTVMFRGTLYMFIFNLLVKIHIFFQWRLSIPLFYKAQVTIVRKMLE